MKSPEGEIGGKTIFLGKFKVLGKIKMAWAGIHLSRFSTLCGGMFSILRKKIGTNGPIRVILGFGSTNERLGFKVQVNYNNIF